MTRKTRNISPVAPSDSNVLKELKEIRRLLDELNKKIIMIPVMQPIPVTAPQPIPVMPPWQPTAPPFIGPVWCNGDQTAGRDPTANLPFSIG